MAKTVQIDDDVHFQLLETQIALQKLKVDKKLSDIASLALYFGLEQAKQHLSPIPRSNAKLLPENNEHTINEETV